MEKFQLSVFLKIIGLGSASGLIYVDNSIYLISDNSTYLYHYQLDSLQLNKIKLFENSEENIPKNLKSDFESITFKDDRFFIIGSGSTENRNKVIIYEKDGSFTQENDLTLSNNRIKEILKISDEDLNIEGVFTHNKKIYYFQRGNGANCKNGIIIAEDKSINKNPKIEFKPIKLPKIQKIETTFTDAILVENKIYFLATAENTTSTYNDGEVLGSLIGCIDFETLKLESTHIITNTIKFEGLTLYKKSKNEIEFLLCEDNDTEILESTIYHLKLKI
ncbi:DUF6929 family protein [Flavobacterium sp.]|uniref:DUF6929 family protein n=1 Tax=Flavobacterium sp. TaxID=239 RepID=UPI003751B9B0